MKYLSVGADAKTIKGEKKGVLTGILYLAPHTLGGGKSICPFSTAGCRAVCLYTAGHGAFNTVQQARIRKTMDFLEDPKQFALDIIEDVKRLRAKAEKKGMTPAVRLNGTSDIEWEKYGIMQALPDIQFYDYTKYPPSKRQDLPPNYHLTFSFSERKHSPEWAHGWRERGVNTAVVFHGGLPNEFLGVPVIDGDESDLRFTDPHGVIVGLKTKGQARPAEYGPGHFVQKGLHG